MIARTTGAGAAACGRNPTPVVSGSSRSSASLSSPDERLSAPVGRRGANKEPRDHRARCWDLGVVLRGLFAELVDAGVDLIGHLGDDQQVVEAEAPGGLPLAVFVGAVEPSEGDVVADGAVVADLVLPDRGLDGSDADLVDVFLRTAPGNKYATAEDGRWRLSPDPSERLAPDAEARLHRLKDWLARHMPAIRLPDLLIEVDNDLRFTNHFLPANQRADRNADGVCLQLATVLAHGCNIGLHTMAQLTPGLSYKQLKRVSDWQLTEEAQRQALAELVGAISRLDATLHWGEGRTSASDGQRFAMPRKVLQQTFSTRFSDYALEFYSFIADNYAPFYSTPIECTDRDAAFVLDGLLYNASDLQLEEHYTDTHGYTEINFAAFAMLGRRFCPRIRCVQHQRPRTHPDDLCCLYPTDLLADPSQNHFLYFHRPLHCAARI